MRIGIFDSGYGGLTVLSRCLNIIEAQQGTHQFIYYADSDWAPYGERSAEEVYQLTRQAVQFLVEQEEIDILVLACNTATSCAVDRLRQEYTLPIIGIEPAIRPALAQIKETQRVLVTATPLMIQSERLNRRIKELRAEEYVDGLALPGLVHLAEQADLTWEQKQQVAIQYLKEQLSESQLSNYGAVVLGCTHFPLFLPAYQHVFKKSDSTTVYFADGAEGVARALGRYLQDQQVVLDSVEEASSEIVFYQSGRRLEKKEEQQFQQLLSEIKRLF